MGWAGRESREEYKYQINYKIHYMHNDLVNRGEFESPLRRMVSSSHNEPYVALTSFADAKSKSDAYLVMEGDDGGQIYLVAPMTMVLCDERVLKDVLRYFDDMAWKDISMAAIRYEIYKEGDTVSGGMGGGRAENGLWIHSKFFNVKEKIERILAGLDSPNFLDPKIE